MIKAIVEKHITAVLDIPLYVAGGSFFLGTLLLLLHLISPKADGEIWLGLLFTLCAMVVNAAVFLLMLIMCFIVPKAYRDKLFIRTAAMLFNIPVVVLYIVIVIKYS